MKNINENDAYDAYDGCDAFSKGVTGLTASRLLLELQQTVCFDIEVRV